MRLYEFAESVYGGQDSPLLAATFHAVWFASYGKF